MPLFAYRCFPIDPYRSVPVNVHSSTFCNYIQDCLFHASLARRRNRSTLWEIPSSTVLEIWTEKRPWVMKHENLLSGCFRSILNETEIGACRRDPFLGSGSKLNAVE